MSERGDLLITRDIWEQFDDQRSALTKFEAYVWVGLYGPAKLNARYLSQHWRWHRRLVMPFARTMIARGVFNFDGSHISAVILRDAISHPELVVGQSWRNLRLRVFARDGFSCTYCGETTDLHCDHVLPRSRGGLDIESNLTTACGPCNLSKGARTPEEWGR